MLRAVVDTSAIVGYFERGDKALKEAVAKYSELIVPAEVVFETVYVLEDNYNRGRVEIFTWLTSLLQKPQFTYDRKPVLNSLFRYRDSRSLSIVDCYVLEVAETLKCELITADEKMVKATRN